MKKWSEGVLGVKLGFYKLIERLINKSLLFLEKLLDCFFGVLKIDVVTHNKIIL
jgi:hypothetical protein